MDELRRCITALLLEAVQPATYPGFKTYPGVFKNFPAPQVILTPSSLLLSSRTDERGEVRSSSRL